MAILKSELTWSFSRDRLFFECRRAYYYNYYVSWGGWDVKADEFSRKAYLLKNIRNIDAWIGDIVHQIIKWVLESKFSGKDITEEQARNKTKQILMATWEQSRSKQWEKNIKRNLNLFEHYYDQEPTREELSVKLAKVPNSISNFYNSGLLDGFLQLPKDDILTIDELDSFMFEGVRVFAVPDFAVRNKGYILYDWKTGSPSEKDGLQLSCYTLYAIQKWGADFDEITLTPVYLGMQPLVAEQIKAISQDQIEQYIRSSIKEMKTVLANEKENIADIKKCPKTSEAWRCKKCKFKEICS